MLITHFQKRVYTHWLVFGLLAYSCQLFASNSYCQRVISGVSAAVVIETVAMQLTPSKDVVSMPCHGSDGERAAELGLKNGLTENVQPALAHFSCCDFLCEEASCHGQVFIVFVNPIELLARPLIANTPASRNFVLIPPPSNPFRPPIA